MSTSSTTRGLAKRNVAFWIALLLAPTLLLVEMLDFYQTRSFISLAGLVCSAVVTWVLISTTGLHLKLTGDVDTSGVQKFHSVPVPRIGGIPIFFSCLLVAVIFGSNHVNELNAETGLVGLVGPSLAIDKSNDLFLGIILAGFPVFVIGLLEDLTKRITPRVRLLGAVVSGFLGVIFYNALLVEVDIFGVDYLLSLWPVSLVFTLFCVAGVSNSINILDGFNGLASGVAIIIAGALAVLSLMVGDYPLAFICAAFGFSVLGFNFINYLTGRIFLGDGGAYFVGFFLSQLAILIVVRNDEISPLLILLLFSYPICEVVFSIVRRRLTNASSLEPDQGHLHHLIYKNLWSGADQVSSIEKTMMNSAVSKWCWAVTLIMAILSFFAFKLDFNPLSLGLACVLSAIAYVFLYKKLEG